MPTKHHPQMVSIKISTFIEIKKII